MKTILLSAFIFILYGSFGQYPQIFREKPSSLTHEFNASHKMVDEVLGVRGYRLTRSEGILVNDLLLNSSFYTQYIHQSGNVIFNSEAGDYLNQIKDLLLKDYPDVQKIIHVYITKNTALNAFATANNNIYINIGLLASVENEAQLAYILSHEIMHIVNNHIVNEELQVNREKTSYDKSDLLVRHSILELYKHSVSRTNETEADMDGFALFSRLYPVQEAFNALSLLEIVPEQDTLLPFQDFFFSDSGSYSAMLGYASDPKFRSLETAAQKDSGNYLTHPLIKDRIATLTDLMNNTTSVNQNQTVFLLSKEKFASINQSAKNLLPDLYLDNFDFVRLFTHSSYAYHVQHDFSERNLENIGLAIQGLTIHKLKEVEETDEIIMGKCDSLLYLFASHSSRKEFMSWSIKAMNWLESKAPSSEKLKSIRFSMKNNTFKKDTVLAKELFPGEIYRTDTPEPMDQLDIEDIDFTVSPYIDLLPREAKRYNQSTGRKNAPGKTAIINMMNYKLIIKDGFFSYEPTVLAYPVDHEKLNIRAFRAGLNLEKDNPNEIRSVFPNSMEYNSEDYDLYVALNQWLSWNHRFEGYSFVHPEKEYIDSITQANDIQYCMSTINIEIKAFSFSKGAVFWLSMIPMPHYIPQSLTNVFLGSTRKYKLTLIYNIKSGNLVFWDKQTSLEPSTTAQFYILYNNIFSNFHNQ